MAITFTTTGSFVSNGSDIVASTFVVTTTATSLPAQACISVTIQNNTNSVILFGDSASQPGQLAKQSAVTIDVLDANKIFVKVASGTATIVLLHSI